MDFLEPKNVFFGTLKCFKSTSDHISYDIDQENGPPIDFPSLHKTWWPNLVRGSQKLAFLEHILDLKWTF